MRIVSWNVNGIRACLDKGLEKVVHEMDADFFCLQESKAHPDQVALLPYPKLHGLHSTWASAEKKGYSGTVIFTPHKKLELRPAMGVPPYDQEGRANLAFGKGFTLVNMYFPNGAASDERHHFKMRFLDELIPWLKKLEKERGPLIICGDYNIAHTEIDIHDPVRNQDSSGFRPEERAWMTKFLESGFVDTFRHQHPGKKDQYSWWSFRQRSRERNKGWRLDYICVSRALEGKIRAAAIHPAVMGSDHCPVSLDISL
ncbi:MAG TPA: exodeoxyribonuclease III [Bdellovibrionota bacterium]|jgi:exodeoxyribonuclease-3